MSTNNPISISTGTLIRAALVVVIFYLAWFLKDFFLIILASIIVASFVESVIPYFKKVHINRVWSVVIFYAIALSVLGLIIYNFFPILISEMFDFYRLLSVELYDSPFISALPTETFSGIKNVFDIFSKDPHLTDLIINSKSELSNINFLNTLSTAFGGLFNFGLIILISFYFSIEEEGIENFIKVITPKRYENYGIDLWKRSRRKIALWVKGQILLAFLVAILIYLILSLLKVKYALLLSLIAGIMNIVPYGTLIALIPAISVSYLSSDLTNAVMVGLAYIVVNQFENFLFAPVIIKGTVGLSPLVIILAAIIGFELSNIWGLILAIPFTVILVEFFTDVEKKKFVTQT